MRRIRSLYPFVTLALLLCLLNAPARAAENDFLVLCYHSVPERYNGDPMAISASNFATQLSWLRDQGYTALRVDDVLKAKAGKIKLPRKSFMLTVDDGYEDFYTNAFPLLKLYNVPAVFGVVGGWIEAGVPVGNDADPYFKKQHFVNWAQLREMVNSGLVEVASHSYDLHRGVLANPQGNTQAAAVTLTYEPRTGSYETVAQQRARIRADLEKNSALIAQHLGKRPRVMVWPYGAHAQVGDEEAARAGMPINFTLDDGLASARDVSFVPRTLAEKEMPLGAFSYLVQSAFAHSSGAIVRAIKIDLDTVYDRDPVVQNAKLGKLLDRVQALGVNAAFVQPFAAPNDGVIDTAYFPTAVVPVRADLLNRVSWQLRSRLGVDVYALMPLTNIAVRERGQRRVLDSAQPADRQRLLTLYENLASHSPLRGVIFIDAPQRPFDGELLAHVSHYRPLAQPRSVGYVRSDVGADSVGSTFPLMVTAAPAGDDDARLAAFAAALPTNRTMVLSLSSENLTREQLNALVGHIRLLQRHGLNNFLLTDNALLDDPVAIAALRQALSLKNNPYLAVGK